MPGPFTHIYAQRRVAEYLARASQDGILTDAFVRNTDGQPLGEQNIDPAVLNGMTPGECAKLMTDWPKFAALGAVGPDMFFFLQDYAQPAIPSDELMLALSLLYWLDDQSLLENPWEGLLAIIGDITGNGFVAVLRFLIKLNTLWSKFLDGLQDLLAPLLDAVDKVIDDLTGGLLTELGDLFTQLKNDLITLIAEEALGWQDVFAFFSLKMRSGLDEQSFVWSDMTHYRLTSYIPRRLLAHAQAMEGGSDLDREHSDQLKAYALGWITHVATDVVGHSFVNAQAGGPFRTHWQRHHLVENHMDAFAYQSTGDGMLPPDPDIGTIAGYEGFNHSALFFAVQIPQDIDTLPDDEKEGEWRKQPLPEADSRVNRKARQELLDVDGAMPTWLSETIVRVFVEVYAQPAEGGLTDPEYVSERGPHPRNLGGQAFQDALGDGSAILGKWLGVLGIGDPGMALSDLLMAIAPKPPADLDVPEGFPLPWEVKTAYRFMLSWFKREFNTSFDMDKPQRPTWFTPPASDFDFGPPDFSGVNPSDDPISQLCEAVLAVLDWIAKTLEKAAQAAYDLAKSAASALTYLPRTFIYDNFTLPAWQVCENMRQVLVHMAYLTPQSELRYANGEIRRPNEIDFELISLGHSVDGAFAAALAAAWDPFGQLDHDPALTAPAERNPKGGPNRAYPWLPVRPTKTRPMQTTGPGIFPFYSDAVEYQRPWGFPDTTNDSNPKRSGNYIETPQTVPGPYPRDAMPGILFEENGPGSNRMRYDYELSRCPEQTDAYNEEFIGRAPFTQGYPVPDGTPPQDISGTNPLGDPIIFATYLIGQIAGNPKFRSNFNLDADRGFGYLCWDWIRDPNKPTTNARGQAYDKPITPPEGTVGEWTYPDPMPKDQSPPPMYTSIPGEEQRTLKLHYPGRTCGKPDHGPASGGNPDA